MAILRTVFEVVRKALFTFCLIRVVVFAYDFVKKGEKTHSSSDLNTKMSTVLHSYFQDNQLYSVYVYQVHNKNKIDDGEDYFLGSFKNLRYNSYEFDKAAVESNNIDDKYIKMVVKISLENVKYDNVSANVFLMSCAYPGRYNKELENIIYMKKNFDEIRSLCHSYDLFKMKKILPSKKFLLQNEFNQTEEVTLPHLHNQLIINIINTREAFAKEQLPFFIADSINKINHKKTQQNFYAPILYFNDFWNLQRDYVPLTHLNNTFELKITFYPIGVVKWNLYAGQSHNEANVFAKQSESDQDMLKQTLLETNFYLLLVTVLVSLLHSVFEFLAFKNDIQFWNSKKDLSGLSLHNISFNIFQSAVVLLYVLDNETNKMVIIGCFVGMLIEFWKITKIVSIERVDNYRFIPYQVTYKKVATELEKQTREYDNYAFKKLGLLLFPLLICYSVYSLIYHTHKSWYSYILGMIYGFLLTFGFIAMTPQLFINYKLKSVAHLPWRMLTYKFLNTFIDDVFAFIIKMPWLYRLGCLRDDVIFFVFLYQKWRYPVDASRVNEFGYSFANTTNEEKKEEEKNE